MKIKANCLTTICTALVLLFSVKTFGQNGPCDILAKSGTPCVAAHSTTRALYKNFKGPLYQVIRVSDSRTKNIGVLNAGVKGGTGVAEAAAQDAFCAGTTCLISKIYDQSGNGNDLLQVPPGTFKGPAKGGFDNLPIADMAPVSLNGHKVYGVYIMPGMGLRNNDAKNIAINDEPEGIYYVVDGKHFDSGCCFDYGNSSTNGRAVGTGTMETTYYGTSTAWGSGKDAGPWIMSDMEAGLFSGYNAKKNEVPSIGNWRFVTAVVDGGGGNRWDLRGGDAQKGALTTYYNGVRPGAPASNAYYPMNKKGGILLGTGGDNGNGSSGTFYEGVMTKGYPTMAAMDAVQESIVTAIYDQPALQISRLTTFYPGTTQKVNVAFTNTTGQNIKALKLKVNVPNGWKLSGPNNDFHNVGPHESIDATFSLTSSANTASGFLDANASWISGGLPRSEKISKAYRNVYPVKINEVRFGAANDPTGQFIELYNGSDRAIDISGWHIDYTPSGSATVSLQKIAPITKLEPHGFYLLKLAKNGLAANAGVGTKTIAVNDVNGLAVGDEINIGGESAQIASVGTSATPPTMIYIPVSISKRLVVPVGAKNLPVINIAGFTVGQKMGIDVGEHHEEAIVTQVGKAGTQANLFTAANAGDQTIKVTDNVNINPGDMLTINTGARKEMVKVKKVLNQVTAPARGNPTQAGLIELEAPLRFNHQVGVDVYEPGTGISFAPALRFSHESADAVQALGSGIVLARPLKSGHSAGAALIKTSNDQTELKPNNWFGLPLSTVGGSLALKSANNLIADAIVYGSQQSNSSANGSITSPELAVMEGDQSQGGCILVVPTAGRNAEGTGKSLGRYPDGYDTDNNCSDFKVQTTGLITLSATAGEQIIKVLNTTSFTNGQKIVIGTGNTEEIAMIATVGSGGGTSIGTIAKMNDRQIIVSSSAGFTVGQQVEIGSGDEKEMAAIATINPARRQGRGFAAADTLKLVAPLKRDHPETTRVAGSGIVLTAPLKHEHAPGTAIYIDVPTPGRSNQYSKN